VTIVNSNHFYNQQRHCPPSSYLFWPIFVQVKLVSFGEAFFILLAGRGVMPKEGLWMVAYNGCIESALIG
jgi:hypothetical protein